MLGPSLPVSQTSACQTQMRAAFETMHAFASACCGRSLASCCFKMLCVSTTSLERVGTLVWQLS